ncbi:hypothetical protein [Jeotgalibacillus marinus]|uniref:Uncharacterized protein n=1 Tax=Jeotgalibacillus marinus TaxID=86667 RepID=A0ABV3Q618_9BACL
MFVGEGVKMGDERAELERQLTWSKEQLRILDEIDVRLGKMRVIAQYAVDNEVSSPENERLNEQMVMLQEEVNLLQASVVPWEQAKLQVKH